eukprot:9474944-Pyramimonas_sp.AAC.2
MCRGAALQLPLIIPILPRPIILRMPRPCPSPCRGAALQLPLLFLAPPGFFAEAPPRDCSRPPPPPQPVLAQMKHDHIDRACRATLVEAQGEGHNFGPESAGPIAVITEPLTPDVAGGQITAEARKLIARMHYCQARTRGRKRYADRDLVVVGRVDNLRNAYNDAKAFIQGSRRPPEVPAEPSGAEVPAEPSGAEPSGAEPSGAEAKGQQLSDEDIMENFRKAYNEAKARQLQKSTVDLPRHDSWRDDCEGAGLALP